jgi:hypothetical protein
MNVLKLYACLLLSTFWLGPVCTAAAQSAPFRYELLSLLPDDFAVCLVMHDLRGHSERWSRSDWLKTFRHSPTGKSLLAAPELQQLARWQNELKNHFDLDGPTLCNDIFGDTVMLAYSPGPEGKQEQERGLFLIRAGKPARLKQFIDQLNQAQIGNGEVKSVTAVRYKEKSYHRRVEAKKTQYYYFDEPLLAVSSREELIRGVIDKQAHSTKANPWAKRFQRAGADQAFVTMCFNPRGVEPDFIKGHQKPSGLPKYWQALEGIFVTLSIQDAAELRVSVQANRDALPSWIRPVFTDTNSSSSVWQYFPESSIATISAQTDLSGLMDALQLLLPEKERKSVPVLLQRTIGAILERDLFKEVLPNIGPDWGVCVLPAKSAEQLPQTIFAVAVKPGSKKPPLDQKIYQSLQFFARFALIDYNTKHLDEIRLQTLMQDKVEVSYLSNDKLFPPGLQPACALKDGFMIFASSPEAILQFHRREMNTPKNQGVPLFSLSTRELAKLVRQRQASIISNLKERQQMAENDARKNVAGVIDVLDLFDRVTLSQHAESGQASWSLRITPALPTSLEK